MKTSEIFFYNLMISGATNEKIVSRYFLIGVVLIYQFTYTIADVTLATFSAFQDWCRLSISIGLYTFCNYCQPVMK